MTSATFVWVFHAAKARFTGGVFSDRGAAEEWIAKHRLTGVLTAYPLNEGCFDWAVREGLTGLKEEKIGPKSEDPVFVGGFSSAAQDHFHYEDGKQTG